MNAFLFDRYINILKKDLNHRNKIQYTTEKYIGRSTKVNIAEVVDIIALIESGNNANIHVTS